MTTVIQSVINNFALVTSQFSKKLSFNINLFLATRGRKNTASMAYLNNVSYEQAYIRRKDADSYIEECKKFLFSLIKTYSTKENPGFLILDFTLLNKPFAYKVDDLSYDYDGISRRISKGLSTGFVVWSNGSITLPLDFTFWHRKKDAGDSYKKKTELVQELINVVVEKIYHLMKSN
jgi:hypothetical protein